ncbi:tail fiber assembly protein [Aeromonas veronii]|uniref:tail fiber assembly protein n=1 Tax=Aeromonas veronii TaxID=654 RepID=UPI003BA27EB1
MTIQSSTLTWDKNGFAEQDGFVKAYNFDNTTREYSGPVKVWVSKGTGLPANAYLDSPPIDKPGFAIVRSQADDWTQVEDHRGTTLYHLSTKATIQVTELGPLPAEYTTQAPTSPFDNWNGQEWVRDQEAEQKAKLDDTQTEQSKRIADVSQQIAILTPAVDGGYAKPEHTQLLADWQCYRYELTLVPEQAGWPESPQWPAEPDKVI